MQYGEGWDNIIMTRKQDIYSFQVYIYIVLDQMNKQI